LPNNTWRFAYAIPYFDDTKGATARAWTTGVLLNNQDSKMATGKLTYTVGQNYSQKGQKFTVPFSLGPFGKKRFDLYSGNPQQDIQGVKDVGYPEGLNTEGHLEITTDTTLLLQPSALIADKSYNFTVAADSD